LSDKEHPAAKAGRYVRAAGIVLGREVDRRATAAAARPVPVAPPPAPPVPPVPTADLYGRAVFGTFVGALVALGIVLLHGEDVFAGSAKTISRLVLGAIMLLESALLTSNWRRANERIGQRLLNRVWGPRSAENRRERLFARVVRDALTLVGIALLAAGVFAVLVATIGVD
jgi:hypothetical protein